MAFIQKSIGTEKGFGSDLQDLRALRGWSREDLSRVTHVHLAIISALEEDRFSDISDLQYAERHVRLLVEALEGRVPFFLHKYRQAITDQQPTKPSSKSVYSFLSRIRRRELFTTTSYLPLFFLIPFAFLLAWYVWVQVAALVADPMLIIYSPTDHQIVTEALVDVRGQTDASATVTVNGKIAIVESDGSFHLPVHLPRGTTELAIRARRRYSGVSETVRYVVYEPALGPFESVNTPILTMPSSTNHPVSSTTGTR